MTDSGFHSRDALIPTEIVAPSLHILTDDALRFGKRITGTKGPWRCFHCDHLAETEEDAEAHFGRFQECTPACQIDVAAYREMEDEVASYRTESDAASKAFYSLGAAHRTALIAAEQAGYDKGLADGQALVTGPATSQVGIANGDEPKTLRAKDSSQ